MKHHFLVLLLAGSIALLGSGCFSSPDGRMRPGVPFSNDTIESRYQRSVDEIFTAAKAVLQFNGTLYGENTIKKTLEAKIDTRTVWVAVDEVEPNVSRVRVQARRKGGLADIALSSEIDKQIALRLTQ
ncbi:MAG: hypothetical protein K9N62_05425 [Verrucomicrobia bacterium]|jgi:hypothetical protein|nr:hypothetical protein [Verrucomicrobiota bacterium]